jgi:SAM-dependent methyltransferase
MQVTKEEFYRLRDESYPLEDPEAIIRYRNALRWMSPRAEMVVREIGCKFAAVRDMLEQHAVGAGYAAVDIDHATLRKVPGYTPEQFFCHDVSRGIPFPDASADYILCLEVLEHLEAPTAFLAEVKRVLGPTGKLILSVPNLYCWMKWLSNLRRRPDAEGHISTFTYQDVDALLRFAGLTLLDMAGMFTRIQFSHRLFGRYTLVETSNMALTRSYMFLIEKP